MGIQENDQIDDKSLVSPARRHADEALTIVPHLPLYDCATTMKVICDNLFHVPICWWPPYTVDLVQRYLPILQAKYGSKIVDKYQQEIVGAFANKKNRMYCHFSDTAFIPPFRALGQEDGGGSTTDNLVLGKRDFGKDTQDSIIDN